MQKLRPRSDDQPIVDNRFDLVTRGQGFAARHRRLSCCSSCRIEQYEFTAAPSGVMSADDANDLRRMIGDRSSVEDAIGPVRVAAVVRFLIRAIGIHAEQQPAEEMRDVRVFPTRV